MVKRLLKRLSKSDARIWGYVMLPRTAWRSRMASKREVKELHARRKRRAQPDFSMKDVKLLNFTNMKKNITIKSFLKKCLAEAGKTEMQKWGYRLWPWYRFSTAPKPITLDKRTTGSTGREAASASRPIPWQRCGRFFMPARQLSRRGNPAHAAKFCIFSLEMHILSLKTCILRLRIHVFNLRMKKLPAQVEVASRASWVPCPW